MQQSLALSKSYFGLAHWGIDQLTPGRTTGWETAAIIGFDIMMFWIPLGDSWVHEEWHRAVMTNRHVGSYNDINNFPIFSDLIAVSHVKDEDLVRLKLEHPADFVRLPAAGNEGENQLMLEMQKDAFFRDTRTFNYGLLWLTRLNAIAYVIASGRPGADETTDKVTASDGANVEVRDFTGLDFTAWVYDLHRPDEPYEARGNHPSGVGLDRYIRYSDLSSAERSYLQLQGILQGLNFLDPGMFGVRRFTFQRSAGPGAAPLPPIEWMLSAFHVLTAFGFDAGLNLFLRDPRGGLHVRFHGYSSGDHPLLPGLEAQVIAAPLRLGSQTLQISPRLSLWLQPDRLRFEGTGVRPGLLAGIRVAWPFARAAWLFAEADAKTEGWVPGNVHLDAAATVRAGVEAVVF
jgi:hypothetical protein